MAAFVPSFLLNFFFVVPWMMGADLDPRGARVHPLGRSIAWDEVARVAWDDDRVELFDRAGRRRLVIATFGMRFRRVGWSAGDAAPDPMVAVCHLLAERGRLEADGGLSEASRG